MDQQIKKAKQKNMLEIYPDPRGLREINGKLRGKCPIHKDALNPNFFIYPKTNTWFCFAGCGGGDTIAFVMKFKKLGFKEAVAELT